MHVLITVVLLIYVYRCRPYAYITRLHVLITLVISMQCGHAWCPLSKRVSRPLADFTREVGHLIDFGWGRGLIRCQSNGPFSHAYSYTIVINRWMIVDESGRKVLESGWRWVKVNERLYTNMVYHITDGRRPRETSACLVWGRMIVDGWSDDCGRKVLDNGWRWMKSAWKWMKGHIRPW